MLGSGSRDYNIGGGQYRSMSMWCALHANDGARKRELTIGKFAGFATCGWLVQRDGPMLLLQCLRSRVLFVAMFGLVSMPPCGIRV